MIPEFISSDEAAEPENPSEERISDREDDEAS